MTIDQNKGKLIVNTLNGQIESPPPIWLMRQAGRHLPEYMELRSKSGSFLDFCYNPDLCVEATLQPIKRYGLDAAILFSDILVIPDALGQQVTFVPGKGPMLKPISNINDIDKLNINNFSENLSPIYKSIEQLMVQLSSFSSNPALIGFAGAPWTVATYMVEGGSSKDYYKTKKWAYEYPSEFRRLINILVDATSEHLINQIKSGAEVIQIFDSWAGILSSFQFDQWVIEPTKEIISRIKMRYPETPIIGFPRGAGVLYEKFVELTNVDAVSLDSTMSLSWAISHFKKDVVIQGNLDNLSLLIGGDLMETEINNILSCISNKSFIFNLGHGVLPGTPISHVERLIEIVRCNRND